MSLAGEGKLLRILIGESDRWEGRPLYEALVYKAREMGMAGATVLRGIEGFGASSVVHTARILRLSEDLPMVIEMVDTAENVDRFLDATEEKPPTRDGDRVAQRRRTIGRSLSVDP